MRNCSEKRGMIPFDREAVLDILFGAETNLTARAYIRRIAQTLSLSPRQAKQVLKSLVDDQTLAYQDLYGSTYVMQSFSKPVRITDRFFIVPPGISHKAGAGRFDIRIFQGISFGSGHHPTTRLCLRAIEHLFFNMPDTSDLAGGRAGDIGTGSGILAIAVCLAGMASCRAWEIDPNAVSEARRNIAANHLDSRITVIDDLMAPDPPMLSLVCANLRLPTLKQLAPLVAAVVAPGAALIFSGIRTWEKAELVSHYREAGFKRRWDRDEKNWSAVIFTAAALSQL